ncbi:MAG TPA: tetratricopeptide repeat protein [Anaerolineae bacterium]|nr:tetratricopeptide repeat protein [Anaerolineae bacterium]
MSEREQLEQAIAHMESQRAILGDMVVDVSLAALRKQLADLDVEQASLTQQRKYVTILFGDMFGFTTMSEMMDAEDVQETMNGLWQRLDKVIAEHGGQVDKHIGDAVMAVWGAEQAREDDPEQAIRAGLEMQKEVGRFTEELELGVRLQMRIGVNTGPVLLGEIGTTGEYTAMGDTVNVASRLEAVAPVGGVLISHDSYRHVRGVFTVLEQEPIEVKGKQRPLRTYVVQKARPRAFHLTTRGVEGIETQMIGREKELKQLQDAVQHVLHYQEMRMVTVMGEAGIGKSRLLYEFEDWGGLLPDNFWFFKARSSQAMERLPFSLLRTLFSFRFQIHDSDDLDTAREKMESGFVKFMGQAGRERSHFVGHLLGFDFSDSPYIQGIREDARQIHNRAFHYAIQFLAAVAVSDPILMLLEDIHWADDGSLDFVELMMVQCAHLPLILICSARNRLLERRPEWGQQAALHQRLGLTPLSREHSGYLVAEILRRLPDIPQVLQEMIISNAGGNPFYVEELIKMMIEDGVISKGVDSWEVVPTRLTEMRVPATLTGVLQARLDRLQPEEREVLQRAAVVGRTFWDETVAYLGGNRKAGDLEQLHDILHELHRKELVFPRDSAAFAHTKEYIFKHTILYEVAYESVLKIQRRPYHQQVAEWLAENSGERIKEYAGLIAHHYKFAGVEVKAAYWYGEAAQQAQSAYAHEAAIDYYHQALTALAQGGDDGQSTIPFYQGLATIFQLQARYDEALKTYQDMRLAAEAAGDVVVQAQAWSGIADVQGNQGHHRDALHHAERAVGLMRPLAETHPIDLADALYQRGWACYRLGRGDEALSLGQESFDLAKGKGAAQAMARSLKLLGAAHSMIGEYKQAWEEDQQALAIWQKLGDRFGEATSLSNLGETARLEGRYNKAVKLFTQALEIAREIGDRNGEMLYSNNLGGAQVGMGRYRDAAVVLESLLEWVPEDWFAIDETYHFLAEAYLGQGRTGEALTAAQQALALAEGADIQEGIGHAWRVLGLVAAKMGKPVPPDPSHYDYLFGPGPCFKKAIACFREGGMPREEGWVLRDWARVTLAQGDKVEGRRLWQGALDIFTRLKLDKLVQKMATERVLFD